MQHASDKSVLGDFGDASFDYYGVRSALLPQGREVSRRDRRARRQARRRFEVKYTFGVEPLQQYLVEFPDGRLQALSLAWDSRPKDKGGQRWFHLYPDEEIKHDDVLHWTRLNQNWNFMCAGCHSTGVRKNYDAATDRFATSFAEISVGCEACHGQGSRHVGWARAQQSWWPFGKSDDPRKGLLVRFDERDGVVWPIDPNTGNARRNVTPAAACARRSRPAACVTRAAANFPRSGCRGARSRTRMPSRRSRAGSTVPTGRCWTRSTTTARSSRAGCSRPASPAAIVTSRTPPSFVRRVTASACNVTPPTNMPRSRTTAMRRRTRRSPARRATCRRAPTWWSTSGTITASAFRVPICP